MTYKLDTSKLFCLHYLESNNFSSPFTKYIPENYLKKLKINIILGVTNIGRDTLLESVLKSTNLGVANIVKRCTTRKKRENDKFMNFCHKDIFKKKVKSGEIFTYIYWKPNKQYYGLEKSEILNKTDFRSQYFMESTYLGLFIKKMFLQTKLILVFPENILQVEKHIGQKRDINKKEKVLRLRNVEFLLKQMYKNTPYLYKNNFIDSVLINKENYVHEVTKKILDVIYEGKRFYELD